MFLLSNMNILRSLILLSGLGICGQVCANRVRRVVGGQDAAPGQFPYVVSLRDVTTGKHFCGGSIIRHKFILTAAHCLEEVTRQDFYIVAGVNTLNRKTKRYYVEKFSIHSYYNTTTNINDIAIIKLKKSLNISKTIQKIPVLQSEPPPGVSMTVCGWGHLFYRGFLSSSLQFSNVTSIPIGECRRRMKRLIYRDFPVTKRHMCTYDGPAIGSCHGDSGGPLVYNGKQVGIVSWIVACASGYPDVYIKLSAYAKWIQFTIKKLNMK